MCACMCPCAMQVLAELHEAVLEAMMTAFLPPHARDTIVAGLKSHGINKVTAHRNSSSLVNNRRDILALPFTQDTKTRLEVIRGTGSSLDILYEKSGSDRQTLRIGDLGLTVPLRAANPELVPHPLFYNIPRHVECLHNMLRDTIAGEANLLLIGNQGVGKNKLADRLLELMRVEREYVLRPCAFCAAVCL